MKKVVWLMMSVLLAAGALAADVTITTNGVNSFILGNAKGQNLLCMSSNGRLYFGSQENYTNDSFFVLTSNDDGATWTNLTVNGFNSLFGAQTFNNQPTLQIIGDTVYAMSSATSSGVRRIAKIAGTTNLSFSGSTYFDTLALDKAGWADGRTVINFRNDSLIGFYDTTTNFAPFIGHGGRLANNGTTAWTLGALEALPNATLYFPFAAKSVAAVWNHTARDVYVSDGYDIDTASTDWPGANIDGGPGYMSVVAASPTDSIVIGAFEIADSAIAIRGKLTHNGTNYVFTAIDTFVLVTLGKTARTENEQNSIFPSVTIMNDSAYIAYQVMADTTDTDTKTICYRKFPIRGAAGTFTNSDEDTLRVSTGADTLWSFAFPPYSYGGVLCGYFQATDNAGTSTTIKSITKVLDTGAPETGVGVTFRYGTTRESGR